MESPAIKKKNTTGVSSDNLISVKRASKRAKKWSLPVEPLKPGKFIHLHKARLLMNFILSKHGREKYSELVFFLLPLNLITFLFYPNNMCYFY